MAERLHLHIPDKFLPEKLYLFDVIFKEWLSLDYSYEIESSDSDYAIVLPNKNKIIFKNTFFAKYSEEVGYLKFENLPITIERMSNDFTIEKNLPIIFGDDNFQIREGENCKEIFCGLDLVASIFFLLTGWEELVCKERDAYGRFMATDSCALKNNFLDRPVANEYLEFVVNLFKYLGFKELDRPFKFQVIPTHDVDFLLYYRNLPALVKKVGGDLFQRFNIKEAYHHLNEYLQIKQNKIRDPFDTYSEFMSLSEENGLQSNFFFMTGFHNEPAYSLKNGFGAKLLAEIESRGHQIGFHGGHQTSDDTHLWQKQLIDLENAMGSKIVYNRQHFLNYKNPDTWQIANQNGIQTDFSVGYSEQEGFRSSSCLPYSIFDLIKREKLNLKASPLIAMDVTLVLKKGLNPAESFNRLKSLANTVKQYQGQFVLLWHNSNWHHEPWIEYQEVYKNILKFK